MSITVYIISDSVGETGELVAKAILSQFSNEKFEIIRESYINTEEQIEEILFNADPKSSICFYTLVNDYLVHYIERRADYYGIAHVDLLSEGLDKVANFLNKEPKREPGLIRKFDEKYFRRVSAVEFTVKYDDGKDPKGIDKADILLIGVSRTSKTPLSMYLAHQNFKVANLPLVPEVEVPKELYEKDSRRIFGLIASSAKLNEIREQRLISLGLANGSQYAQIERIEEELDYSRKLMWELGCFVIDVSQKAVEETAGIIINRLRESFGDELYLDMRD